MLIALAVLAATPAGTSATSQPSAVAANGSEAQSAAKKNMPDMDFTKMLAVFDKIFPPQPDPDPARLAAARGVAARMWPDGTYGMLLDSFVAGMANRVLDMKPAELAMFEGKKGDKEADKKPEPSPAKNPAALTLREQLRRDDPHFDKRLEAITAALRGEFARMSPMIEPNLREGLSRSLARRFTGQQLADLNSFYQSPTGQVYARESLKMWFDSDVMRSTFNSMPTIMLQLPGAMQRVEAAAKAYPMPPRKPTAPKAK